MKGLKLIVPHDIVRYFVLLLKDNNFKCFVGDLSGDTLNGKHTGIDATGAQVLAYYALIIHKFINAKEAVSLHCDLTDPST